jgi:polyene macrolide polyketide synthase
VKYDKSAAVQRWLKPKHRRRFHFHCTPPPVRGSTRLNAGLLSSQKKRFVAARSTPLMNSNARSYAWLATWNDAPKPFAWNATAGVILEKASV